MCRNEDPHKEFEVYLKCRLIKDFNQAFRCKVRCCLPALAVQTNSCLFRGKFQKSIRNVNNASDVASSITGSSADAALVKTNSSLAGQAIVRAAHELKDGKDQSTHLVFNLLSAESQIIRIENPNESIIYC